MVKLVQNHKLNSLEPTPIVFLIYTAFCVFTCQAPIRYFCPARGKNKGTVTRRPNSKRIIVPKFNKTTSDPMSPAFHKHARTSLITGGRRSTLLSHVERNRAYFYSIYGLHTISPTFLKVQGVEVETGERVGRRPGRRPGHDLRGVGQLLDLGRELAAHRHSRGV